MTNQLWHDDPRHLVFILARYKFVAKMLQGKETALEVGCGDAFATRIVQQVVPNVTAIDFDPIFIEDAKARLHPDWPMELLVHDILEAPLARDFEAAYSVDVLEQYRAERRGALPCQYRRVGHAGRRSDHRNAVAGEPGVRLEAEPAGPYQL